MTRKRFEKLVMSTGIQRNTAKAIAKYPNTSFLKTWNFLSNHRNLLYIYGATEKGINALYNYRISCYYIPQLRFH